MLPMMLNVYKDLYDIRTFIGPLSFVMSTRIPSSKSLISDRRCIYLARAVVDIRILLGRFLLKVKLVLSWLMFKRTRDRVRDRARERERERERETEKEINQCV
jgi:hypothetical protein